MNFDAFDAVMRVYETAHDHCVLPGMYIVARLDGRSFSRLTKETHAFEAPFDERFSRFMTETTAHLMDCGFRIVYGYTESDEISLLFHPEDQSFGRKERKINSILAGEASAKFSLLLGDVAAFDCRVCQLPNEQRVVDYFRWRQEDAARNALNAHAYWLLRKQGMDAKAATKRLLGLSVPDKHELLFEAGINFNHLPAWQKRGVGLWWVIRPKEGLNPKTGEQVLTQRRGLHQERELPLLDEYANLVQSKLHDDA